MRKHCRINARGCRRACLASLLWGLTLCVQAQEVTPIDTLRVDTLREISVQGKEGIQVPLSNSLTKGVAVMKKAEKYSLNGLIQHYFPTLHDQITHPFGFAERRRNRKRKKVRGVLQQYDALARDPLKMLLDSVARARAAAGQDK